MRFGFGVTASGDVAAASGGGVRPRRSRRPPMSADGEVPVALLLLADGRLPTGAYAHSGGLAAAVDTGRVRTLEDLAAFLAGRLASAGLLAAAAAARAAHLVSARTATDTAATEHAGGSIYATAQLARTADAAAELALLDAELDARTPSPAAREASRAQGRGLLRTCSRAWPSPALAVLPDRPYAPVALGAAAVAVGTGPAAAARLAALSAVTGPASAAVRLLGLDPLDVATLLARLAGRVQDVADAAVAAAEPGRPLPAPTGPLLDLLAQAHARARVRLFAS